MVLITGGLGYLGGRIAEYLIQSGFHVRIGTSQKYPDIPNTLKKCDVVTIDLTNDLSLFEATIGVTHVIHLAALNAKDSEENPESALLINGLGTYKLLKASEENDVQSFIYFSTVHVYGSPLCGLIDESTQATPLHHYSISHKTAEDFVIEADTKGRISGLVLRLSNAVGPPLNQNTNCWMLVANDFCRQAVENKRINVYSDSLLVKDFIPISTICFVVRSILNKNIVIKGIANLSSNNSITLGELASIVAIVAKESLGYTPVINFIKGLPRNKATELEISNKKILNTGVMFKISLIDEIDTLLLACKTWFGRNDSNL